jgi:hypothetical protein
MAKMKDKSVRARMKAKLGLRPTGLASKQADFGLVLLLIYANRTNFAANSLTFSGN